MHLWLNSLVVRAVVCSDISVCRAADRVALVIGNSKYAGEAEYRVYRGGGYFGTAGRCRSAYRGVLEHRELVCYLGFRIAFSPVR
jgi:formylglycine-generating enzyme required for sulfatase activity